MQSTRLFYLRNLLKQNKLDAVLISSVPHIIHLTNFSHFSELEREGFLLITQTSQYIFTDARYSYAVRTDVKHFKLQEISIQQPLTTLLQNIVDEEKIKYLGVEENNITVSEYQKFSKIFKQVIHVELETIRTKKHTTEIEKIKKACKIGDKAFSFILKKIKLGITEKELAFLVENFIRETGAIPSFTSIIAFGKNAAIPHHKSSNHKLKQNEFVLLDFGVKYENYCSDMTRTIFFGKANAQEKKIYQAVKDAQQIAIDMLNNKLVYYTKTRRQVMAKDIDQTARNFIIKKGYPSIPHSLGHGIGLQVHEAPSLSPKSKDLLENGMVFSIEPGIYLPDKMGVRIEDLFTIHNNQLIQLTKSSHKFREV